MGAVTAGSLGQKLCHHFQDYSALLPPLYTNEIIRIFLLIAWKGYNFSAKCPVINEIIKISIPRYPQALTPFIAFIHLESPNSSA